MDGGQWLITLIAIMVMGLLGLLSLMYSMLLMMFVPMILMLGVAFFLFGLPLYWVVEWGGIGWLGAVVCWPLSYWLMNSAFDLYFFKRDK